MRNPNLKRFSVTQELPDDTDINMAGTKFNVGAAHDAVNLLAVALKDSVKMRSQTTCWAMMLR